MATIRALLIGRHNADFGDLDIEVVEARPVTFPNDIVQTKTLLHQLNAEAASRGLTILLQNIPAVVGVALVQLTKEGLFVENPVRWGVVISVPGQREAGKQITFEIPANQDVDGWVSTMKQVNPNAKIDVAGIYATVTFDPPMKFMFSHIEWFNESAQSAEETRTEGPVFWDQGWTSRTNSTYMHTVFLDNVVQFDARRGRYGETIETAIEAAGGSHADKVLAVVKALYKERQTPVFWEWSRPTYTVVLRYDGITSHASKEFSMLDLDNSTLNLFS